MTEMQKEMQKLISKDEYDKLRKQVYDEVFNQKG